ncbi:MAG TPA: hypothetical protein VKX49_29460 [Bryobacteraceae bacterium]|nr:hypothetical protein [Bryobacteraceae bacterium]
MNSGVGILGHLLYEGLKALNGLLLGWSDRVLHRLQSAKAIAHVIDLGSDAAQFKAFGIPAELRVIREVFHHLGMMRDLPGIVLHIVEQVSCSSTGPRRYRRVRSCGQKADCANGRSQFQHFMSVHPLPSPFFIPFLDAWKWRGNQAELFGS